MAFILANSQLSLGANSFVPMDFTKKDNDGDSADEDQLSEGKEE